jgi:hypothetical protein
MPMLGEVFRYAGITTYAVVLVAGGTPHEAEPQKCARTPQPIAGPGADSGDTAEFVRAARGLLLLERLLRDGASPEAARSA